MYINGYPRKKVRKPRAPVRKATKEEQEINAPTSEERAVCEVEAIIDGDDEEAILNTPMVLEDEEERHRPRDPLLCMLQTLNSVCALLLFSHSTDGVD